MLSQLIKHRSEINLRFSYSKELELETKTFAERESLITELLEVKHFKTLKHLFFALLFGFLAKDLIRALSKDKK